LDYLTIINKSMTWTYQNKPLETIPEGYENFVYLIKRLSDGKKYVGKKAFYSTTRPIKNVTLKSGEVKKKKVKTVKESDWHKYYGSSDELKEDVKLLGKEAFSREILHFCKTKSEASYLELKEQILRNVMETEHSYNKYIGVELNKANLQKADFYDKQSS